MRALCRHYTARENTFHNFGQNSKSNNNLVFFVMQVCLQDYNSFLRETTLHLKEVQS